MINFLMKDIRVIVRDKTELLLLLLMPFVLIGILGFALGGMLAGGGSPQLQMDVAVVNEDNEDAGIEQFIVDLEAMQMPDEAVDELTAVARDVSPAALLDAMLTSDELSEMITIHHADGDEADESLAQGDVRAILTIPEDFTYDSLKTMVIGDGSGASLNVKIRDESSISAGVFQEIIASFARNLNMETAIASELGAPPPEGAFSDSDVGGFETVTGSDPVNSIQYYAVGMAVMFVLYIGGAVASKAYVEKQQHVFNRILLADRSPLSYLGGKAVSGAILAFLQLAILFTMSALVFQTFDLTSLTFWAGMAAITAVLAVCAGALASLITAVTVRYDNKAYPNIFNGGVVVLLAFAGGSFFPTVAMPEALVAFGGWTPNGAAMTAYLHWIQGVGFDGLTGPLVRLLILAAVFLTVSIAVFPKRRSV